MYQLSLFSSMPFLMKIHNDKYKSLQIMKFTCQDRKFGANLPELISVYVIVFINIMY